LEKLDINLSSSKFDNPLQVWRDLEKAENRMKVKENFVFPLLTNEEELSVKNGSKKNTFYRDGVNIFNTGEPRAFQKEEKGENIKADTLEPIFIERRQEVNRR
jgi:hypothetical protein